MVIALLSTSILLLITFLSISLYLYKKANQENYNLSNHFPFEIYNRLNPVNSFTNAVLLMAFICFTANFVLYAVNDLSFNTIMMCLLALAITTLSMLLLYIPIGRFRCHVMLVISLAICSVMINVFLLFSEVRALKIYEQNLYIFPIVVQSLLVVTYLFFIFHPSLFNLKMNGEERPKTIFLALLEWVVIITIFLSQIGLLFFDILG